VLGVQTTSARMDAMDAELRTFRSEAMREITCARYDVRALKESIDTLTHLMEGMRAMSISAAMPPSSVASAGRRAPIAPQQRSEARYKLRDYNVTSVHELVANIIARLMQFAAHEAQSLNVRRCIEATFGLRECTALVQACCKPRPRGHADTADTSMDTFTPAPSDDAVLQVASIIGPSDSGALSTATPKLIGRKMTNSALGVVFNTVTAVIGCATMPGVTAHLPINASHELLSLCTPYLYPCTVAGGVEYRVNCNCTAFA